MATKAKAKKQQAPIVSLRTIKNLQAENRYLKMRLDKLEGREQYLTTNVDALVVKYKDVSEPKMLREAIARVDDLAQTVSSLRMLASGLQTVINATANLRTR